MKEDDRIKFRSEGKKYFLDINKATLDDQAKYTVVAEEGVESTAKLTVIGKLYSVDHILDYEQLKPI